VFVFFTCFLKKPNAARNTKLDIEMFHHQSWKPVYFGVKKSKVKVTRHKKCRRGSLHSFEFWLFLITCESNNSTIVSLRYTVIESVDM